MTELEKQKLFMPFGIASNQSLNKFGSGIGLCVVNDILTAYNIQIKVESVKKKGTTFYFDLDYIKQNSLMHQPGQYKSQGQSQSQSLFAYQGNKVNNTSTNKEEEPIRFKSQDLSAKFKIFPPPKNDDEIIIDPDSLNSKSFMDMLSEINLDSSAPTPSKNFKNYLDTGFEYTKNKEYDSFSGSGASGGYSPNLGKQKETFYQIKIDNLIGPSNNEEDIQLDDNQLEEEINESQKMDSDFLVRHGVASYSSSYMNKPKKNFSTVINNKKTNKSEKFDKTHKKHSTMKNSTISRSKTELFKYKKNDNKKEEQLKDSLKSNNLLLVKKGYFKSKSFSEIVGDEIHKSFKFISPSEKINIFVCDDTYPVGLASKKVLEKVIEKECNEENLPVVTYFQDELECLKNVIQFKTDNKQVNAIFMDENLPTVKGSEILDFVQKVQTFKDIKLYLLTGDLMSDEFKEKYDGIYSKPLSPANVNDFLKSNDYFRTTEVTAF